MRTLKLTLAYDGTGFVGWQRQAEGVSIQGLVEEALGRACGADRVPVTGAGRTDAGVHALAQTASASVETSLACADLLSAINARLPASIRVRQVEDVPASFHARFSAREKTYAYRVACASVLPPFEERYAWHVRHRLDVAAMRTALGAVVGTHDFAALQAAGSETSGTVRTIHAAELLAGPLRAGPVGSGWDSSSATGIAAAAPALTDGELLTILLRGDGFLRHMVRTIAGTLIEVGRGRWPAGAMRAVLESADRTRAGPTAPPQGLFLVSVGY